MKLSGISRKVDPLGRIVIPKEMRTSLGITELESLDISMEEGRIVLQKLDKACTFCGREEANQMYMGKWICEHCRKALWESGPAASAS